ncbi:hypothetical protein BCV70DRAFT_213461 [Testicularia cyperi]|uniref:RING-type domain-containing protein n=1 Tax=Testicularia cyperi TaxID=1882483 RepID=A0A317XHJ3_9BASI|nr:hypothetical protein BCV70DRAFT_213461 [Testicularia cyperi]
MPGLLSLRRSGRPEADVEAGVAMQQSSEPRRWNRIIPGRNAPSAANQPDAVESNAISTQAQSPPVQAEVEQAAAAQPQQGTSGRSLFALSPFSRHRQDRPTTDNVPQQQDGQRSNYIPTNSMGGGGGNIIAAVLLPPTVPAAAPQRSAKKSRNSRREREEAATLFGPNLANYFGSGNSSSGAVSGSGTGPPLVPVQSFSAAIQTQSLINGTAPAETGAITDNSGNTLEPVSPGADGGQSQGSLPSRRARLGSRGRARGASLSGLSMMSLGAESVTSLGGLNPERPVEGAAPQGMMQGSTADLIGQLTKDGAANEDDIAMSEGVDVTTLRRWIERSMGGDYDAISRNLTESSISGPPICTTLQSYVNLKRNTLKLSAMPPPADTSSAPTPLAIPGQSILSHPLDGKSGGAGASVEAVNLLRAQSSLSMLPNLSYDNLNAGPSADQFLPNATHTLYFEYDCAAPHASVQIFIRASRKHGSWLNYNTADASATVLNDDGSVAVLAQRGPPPHVLGWPVHVAKLQKGFGSKHTAAIPLDLRFYAPPKASKGQSTSQQQSSDLDTKDCKRSDGQPSAPEAVTPAAVPETPGFEFHRRLELEQEEAEEEARATASSSAARRRAASASASAVNSSQNGNSTATAPSGAAQSRPEGPVAEAVIEEETKEQRLAREKAERETLKLAIVVEALDENARPLRDPNLQTSYLRITSLPARKPIADRLAEAATQLPEVAETETATPRVWSAQVEGQEAEIGPHRFQLQELYGLSSKPPPVRAAPPAGEGGEDADNDEDAAGGAGNTAAPNSSAFLAAMDMEASNGTECLICLSSPPTTLLLPCTHGLCLECAVQLRDSVIGIRQSERRRGRTPRRKYACPVCRRAYTSMLHLGKADEKVLAQTSASHQH